MSYGSSQVAPMAAGASGRRIVIWRIFFFWALLKLDLVADHFAAWRHPDHGKRNADRLGRVFVARRRSLVFRAVVFGRGAVRQLVHHVDLLDHVHELDLMVRQNVGHFPDLDGVGLGFGGLSRLVDRAADGGVVSDRVAQDVAGRKFVLQVVFLAVGRRARCVRIVVGVAWLGLRSIGIFRGRLLGSGRLIGWILGYSRRDQRCGDT